MNHLLDLNNVSDRVAVQQTNMERLDASLAFALNPSRVGGVATVDMGPPTTGSHYEGEMWLDVNCAAFRCTVAGTPGTWIQITPAVVAAEPGGAPNGYLIRLTTDWSEEYWDGAVWQAV
jgi:hypothetical protein